MISTPISWMAEEPQHLNAGTAAEQTTGFHPGSNVEAGFSAERELVEKAPANSCLEIRQEMP